MTGLAASGSHAAFATARADELVPVPDGLDDASAAVARAAAAHRAMEEHRAIGKTLLDVRGRAQG